MTDKLKEYCRKIHLIRNELKQLREENKYVYNKLEQRNKDIADLLKHAEELNETNAVLRQENEKVRKEIIDFKETIKNSVSKDFTLQAIAAAAGNSNF